MKTWTRPTRQKLSQASITISTQWGHDPRATGASSGQYWITHRLNLIRISHNTQTYGKDLCKRIHNSLSAKTGCHMDEVWSAIKPVDTGLSHCGVLLSVQIWFHINSQGGSTPDQHSPSEDQSIFILLKWTKARFIMAECNCSAPSSSAKVLRSIWARK